MVGGGVSIETVNIMGGYTDPTIRNVTIIGNTILSKQYRSIQVKAPNTLEFLVQILEIKRKRDHFIEENPV